MFHETLIQLENGATVAELSNKLRDLVQAVRTTAKAGTLTLTVKVSPMAANNVDVLVIEAKVAAKTPEPDRKKNIFFSTDAGELSRRDPKQMDLPLRPQVVDIQKEAANG